MFFIVFYYFPARIIKLYWQITIFISPWLSISIITLWFKLSNCHFYKVVHSFVVISKDFFFLSCLICLFNIFLLMLSVLSFKSQSLDICAFFTIFYLYKSLFNNFCLFFCLLFSEGRAQLSLFLNKIYQVICNRKKWCQIKFIYK